MMNPDEMYVRERWAFVDAYNYRGLPHIAVKISFDGSLGKESGPVFVNSIVGDSEAWKRARAFTEQREEEIRQVEEEIALLKRYKESREQILNSPYLTQEWAGTGEPLKQHVEIFTRILASRQAALAELTRGMVGDGKGKR